MAKAKRKGGLGRKLLAVVLGAVAAKVALKATEKLWTKGFRKELPDMSSRESMGKKAAWTGLSAAAVGMAREAARDVVAPKAEKA